MSERNGDPTSKCSSPLLAVAIGFCLLASRTQAADTPTESAALGEIVVTAQRVSQNLQDAPLAVSAFDANEVHERALASIADVGRSVPNAVFTDGTAGGGRNANFFIRGIGQTDILVSSDPGVGVYIDEVYLGQVVGSSFDLLDVERIEVLRGPQGTLYGKNSIGGLVHVVTAAPDREGGGAISIGTGSRNRIQVDGTIDVPVGAGDGALKAAFSYRKQDGYGNRLSDGGDQSDQNLVSGRIKYQDSLGDSARVTVAFDGTRAREAGSSLTLVAVNPAAGVLALYNALVAQPQFGTRLDQRYLTSDVRDTYSTGPNDNDLDNWGGSLKLEGDAPWGHWKSISAVRNLHYTFTRDGDNSPLQYVEAIRRDRQRQYSQEFQLGSDSEGRLSWIAGVYWFHERASEHNTSQFATGLFQALESLPTTLPGTPFGGAGNPANLAFDVGFDSFFRNTTNSYAAYTQGSLKIGGGFKLTAGMRYTAEEKDVDLRASRLATGRIAVAPTSKSDRWDAWTPRVAIEYEAPSGVLAYVSASRGFKSGGFNGRALDANALAPYDPEFVTTYEAGVKGEFFDRRIRANLAVFYSKYKDIQLTAITSVNGAIFGVTQNVAEATIKGGELELQAVPVEGLTVSASVGILKNSFDRVAAGTQGITLASRLPLAPETTATAGIRYAVPFVRNSRLTLRTDYSYRDSVFTDVVNTPILRQPGFGLLSAAVMLEPEGERWALTLAGANLTDKEYLASGVAALASAGTADGHYGRPREWTLNFAMKF